MIYQGDKLDLECFKDGGQDTKNRNYEYRLGLVSVSDGKHISMNVIDKSNFFGYVRGKIDPLVKDGKATLAVLDDDGKPLKL